MIFKLYEKIINISCLKEKRAYTFSMLHTNQISQILQCETNNNHV